MYRDRSGAEGHGGTEDFSTYLLKSGSRQGGHIGRGFGQPHGHCCLQELQVGSTVLDSNPSFCFIKALLRIIPNSIPTKRASPGTTKLICFVIGDTTLFFTSNLRTGIFIQ